MLLNWMIYRSTLDLPVTISEIQTRKVGYVSGFSMYAPFDIQSDHHKHLPLQ